MDGKTEELHYLQDLGTFGIVKEGWRIMKSRAKLLGSITLALILPLCVASLLHSLISIPIILGILSNEILIPNGDDVDEEWASRELCRQLTEFFLMEMGYAVFAFATWMVSTSSVVYTVACFYTSKHEHPFRRVLSFAYVVWKRLALTSLWFLMIIIGVIMGYGFICFLFIWSLRHVDNIYVDIFRFVGLVTWTVVVVHVCVYARVTWQVASVVAVLEEKYYGWEAMMKGHRLMEDKRRTATWLTLLYLMIEGVYGYGVMSGDWEIATSCAYGTLLVVVECVVSVVWEVSNGVLYFVCKYHKGESIDEWFLVEGMWDYLPVSIADVEGEPKNSVKNIV